MAGIRKICRVGDPVLRQPAMEVQRFNRALHHILEDMACTMYDAKGCGLAAPQIGISKQIVVVDEGDGRLWEFINPHIVEKEGEADGVEYCLSVPVRGGIVPRATRIVVEAQDRNGEYFSLEVKDMLARIIQHETDHLEGRLFIDIMKEEIED